MAQISIGVPLGLVWGLAILGLGTALLVGSRFGYARWLILPIGLLGLVAAPAVDAGVRVETMQAPRALSAGASSVPSGVRSATGDLLLDFSQLSSTREFQGTYEVLTGDITVILPPRMYSEVSVHRAPVAQTMSGDANQVQVLRPVAPGTGWIPDPKLAADADALSADHLASSSELKAMDRVLAQNSETDDASYAPFAERYYAVNSYPNVAFTITEMRSRERTLQFAVDPQAKAEVLAKEAGVANNEVPGDKSSAAPSPTTVPSANRPSTASAARGSLHLDLRSAFGTVTVIEPIWSMGPAALSDREAWQSCVEAGGRRGVVKRCSDLPKDSRVPTCLMLESPQYLEFSLSAAPTEVRMGAEGPSPAGTVVKGTTVTGSPSVGDCRDFLPEGIDPRDLSYLACSDGSMYYACSELGIANSTSIQVDDAAFDYGDPNPAVGETVPPIAEGRSPTSASTESPPTSGTALTTASTGSSSTGSSSTGPGTSGPGVTTTAVTPSVTTASVGEEGR
jgi:hypothetical protein